MSNSEEFSYIIETNEITSPTSVGESVQAETNGVQSDQQNNLSNESTEQAGSDNTHSNGLEVVAEGAVCQCTMGSSLGKMKVLRQTKVLCNGGSKLVATDKEKDFMSVNFGSCSAMKNAPCMGSFVWQNPYEEVTILGGMKILTIETKGVCSKGGQIEFQTSGQSQSVSSKDIRGVDREVLKSDSPLASDIPGFDIQVDFESFEELKEQLQHLSEEELAELKNRITKENLVTGIIPITYNTNGNQPVTQPHGRKCVFQAVGAKTVTWQVRDENLKVILKAVDSSPAIGVTFPKKDKKYVIEAFRNESQVKEGQTIDTVNHGSVLRIQTAANEINLEASRKATFEGGNIEIIAKKLFADVRPSSLADIQYEVRSDGIVVDPKIVTLMPNASGVMITFYKKGVYEISAKDIDGAVVRPIGGIEVKALLVKKVTAGGETTHKTRIGRAVDLKAHLNFNDGDKSKIKWEVHYKAIDGQMAPYIEQTFTKPASDIFKQLGTYHVYAYMGQSRAEAVKAVVEINQPRFLLIRWVDGNGNTTLKIGKKEKVYAQIIFEYIIGLNIKLHLCIENTDEVIWEKECVLESNVLVASIEPLETKITSKLKEGQKLYWEIISTDNTVLSNKDRLPKDFPIQYTNKTDIVSLKFYSDKTCKQLISSASYGETVYAKAVIRNATEGKFLLKLTRKKDWRTVLCERTETVNEDGAVVFEIPVGEEWALNSDSDQYQVFMEEEGGTVFKDSYDETFRVGVDTNIITFNGKRPKSIVEQVLTFIGLGNSETDRTVEKTGKCSKCKQALTVDDLKHIKENKIPSGFIIRLEQMLPYLNKYMEAFGINQNCLRRAHFLGQIAKETGFWNLFEDLNHSKETLDAANFPNRSVIIEKGYYKKNGKISEKDMVRMGNIGYGTGSKASGLGNNVVAEKDWADPTKDGYKYRGRGLIQLTGKANYQSFQTWYNSNRKANGWGGINFVDNPDLLSTKLDGNKISNPEMMVLSAIYFWDKNNLNTKADEGEEPNHTKGISLVVNRGESEVSRASRHKLFKHALNHIKDESVCKLSEVNKIPLSATDITTYHIYATGRKIVKQIPSTNNYPEMRRYVYHDKSGKKHVITDLKVVLVPIVKYRTAPEAIEGKVELIDDIRNFKGYTSPDGKVKAVVKKWDSNEQNRWYINPECFAGILGAMLDLNIDILVYRGASQKDGRGGGSKSHLNGVATDIAYFATDKRTSTVLLEDKELDLQLNVDFINALIGYGYRNKGDFCTETFIPHGKKEKRYLVDGMTEYKKTRHNNHLHIGGFDFKTVIVKN